MNPSAFATRPTYVLHKSYQRSQRLDEVVDLLEKELGRHVLLGVAVNLPRQAPAVSRRLLDSFGSSVVLRIADPEIFLHQDQVGGAPSRAAAYEYMRMRIPPRVERDWVEAVTDAQRSAGATVLLSATGWVEDAQAQESLQRAFNWIAESRRVVGDDAMFVNLALPGHWLSNADLRARLLNEIVESNEALWYIRVRWGVMTPRYGQLRDAELLKGYREMAEVMSNEGRTLIAPTSGLAGWLVTAWGGAGFSTGAAIGEQAFADQPQIRMRAGAQRVRRHRYFERGLLHTVDLTTHTALLASKTYEVCDCPFCAELNAADPDVDPADWSAELAALHYLVQLGRLTRRLATRNPRAAAARELQRARANYQAMAADLAGENVPQHLRVWDPLLR